MKFRQTHPSLLAFLFVSFLFMPVARVESRSLVPRDHLTPQEVDRVKEAQALDKRTAVFIKAIERRLLVLTDPNAAVSKQVQKETEKWGELPKGTRPELIGDIAKILDEAINNIDDVSTRDENNPLLPKSLRLLAAASTRFATQLTQMRDRTRDKDEHQAIEQALEYVQSIIEAANKLPAETEKKKKDKS
jgi:hypothetical protein